MITSKFNDPILEYAAQVAARYDLRMEDPPAGASDAGGGGGDVEPTANTPDPVKEAGKAFLASLTEEQLNNEVGTIEDGEIATIPAEGKPKRKVKPPAAAAAGAPKPKPAAGATTPRAKDGKFAAAGTVDPDAGDVVDEADLTDEQLESLDDEQLARIQAGETFAQVTAPADPELEEEGADPAKPKVDDPEAVVVLKGLEDRGEEDVELEITDPVIRERIRRLQNDGLRRTEYNERLEAVEARDTELRQAEAMIEANPIGFVIGLMGQENQLEVARALLAEHFEALAPTIEEFFDKPDAVPKAQLKARDQAQKNNGEATRRVAAQNAARAIERSVRDLIPETVDRKTAERFMRDAERDLLDAVGAGERVSPTTAAVLLKDRLKMYGFGPDTVKDKPAPAGARPLSDRAKALADKRSKASAQQARIKRTQLARRNAAAVAPPGAGGAGATVREPLIPKDATIGEASKVIRQRGITSWADIQRG